MNWEALYGSKPSDLETFVLEAFREVLPAARKLRVHPDIQDAQRREATFLPASEPFPICLGNASALGQGTQYGFAVTTNGLFWRNFGEADQHLGFAAITGVPTLGGDCRLDLGDGKRIDMQSLDGTTIDGLIAFIVRAAHAAREGPPEAFVKAWYLQQDGDHMGPYSPRDLADLIGANVVRPFTTLAWREGMADWETLAHLDVVSGVLKDLKAASGPPRATPASSANRIVSRSLKPVPVAAPNATVGQKIDGWIDAVKRKLGRDKGP